MSDYAAHQAAQDEIMDAIMAEAEELTEVAEEIAKQTDRGGYLSASEGVTVQFVETGDGGYDVAEFQVVNGDGDVFTVQIRRGDH